MNAKPNPVILPPTSGVRPRARRLFSDQNLDLLAYILDDWFRIPGTQVRLGIDGLIGIIPGIGDVLAGLLSCILIFGAWVRGVPYVTLFRMVVNLGIGVLVGAIPFAGDIFDIFWKPNHRNYELITRHLREPHRHTWKDAAFLAVLALLMLIILATPVIVLVLLVFWMMHRF